MDLNLPLRAPLVFLQQQSIFVCKGQREFLLHPQSNDVHVAFASNLHGLCSCSLQKAASCTVKIGLAKECKYGWRKWAPMDHSFVHVALHLLGSISRIPAILALYILVKVCQRQITSTFQGLDEMKAWEAAERLSPMMDVFGWTASQDGKCFQLVTCEDDKQPPMFIYFLFQGSAKQDWPAKVEPFGKILSRTLSRAPPLRIPSPNLCHLRPRVTRAWGRANCQGFLEKKTSDWAQRLLSRCARAEIWRIIQSERKRERERKWVVPLLVVESPPLPKSFIQRLFFRKKEDGQTRSN